MFGNPTSEGDEAGATGLAATTKDRIASLWFEHCGSCHGALGQGTDLAPNVSETSGDLSQEEVVEVILNGFGLMDPVSLDLEQAEAIARFLIDEL